ncbi:glycosyltransferase [Candidatus Micrarchaeota archaeon]|nr:glycosyltransferase [Candidatus Micrarchaeota archaeon]
MRIAFFTETYLPNRDGVVSSIINTRKELERRGHEVYIFCSGSSKAKKENKDKNVFYYTSTTFKPYPQYRVAIFPFLAERKVKTLKIDVIHTHGMATMGLAALQASRMLKIPLVSTFHTFVTEAMHYITKRDLLKGLTQRIAWTYLRWYLNRCNLVIAPSTVAKGMLEKYKVKNIDILPSGIDLGRFNPEVDGNDIRKRWNLEDRIVALHVGRVALEKNLELLIDASLLVLEELPNTTFVIVGTGPALEHYKNLVIRHNVEKSFIFTGLVKDEELPSYYSASDVLVFPSKFETQGLVALEAMACGKPVAGADYLAIKELVKDGYNGYLFDINSVDDCAEKVIKTIKKRKELSKNAVETAKEYGIEKSVDRLVEIYKRCVKKQFKL